MKDKLVKLNLKDLTKDKKSKELYKNQKKEELELTRFKKLELEMIEKYKKGTLKYEARTLEEAEAIVSIFDIEDERKLRINDFNRWVFTFSYKNEYIKLTIKKIR